MTAVPPLGDADPATRFLVAGYGAITAGIIPHLIGLTATHVTVASRHSTPQQIRLLPVSHPEGWAAASAAPDPKAEHRNLPPGQ
ncbi:hypothetical protein [Streptomyces yangpuensis]|uniref:hypothetical protein n=1 Tax=Streptomyces yangpuensis TaxID=1648182 RepID=UPI00381FD41B